MTIFESLKKQTDVPPQKNYEDFRAAVNRVAGLKIPASLKDSAGLLLEVNRAYMEISEEMIAGQKAEHINRRRKIAEAAKRLTYFSILFHLNFFEPNFFGITGDAKFQRCLQQMAQLFRVKNRDYGNSFRFWGVIGLLVRLGDKIFRLQQLTQKGYRRRVKDEKIPDTALDLANYSLMLLILLNEGRHLKLGQ